MLARARKDIVVAFLAASLSLIPCSQSRAWEKKVGSIGYRLNGCRSRTVPDYARGIGYMQNQRQFSSMDASADITGNNLEEKVLIHYNSSNGYSMMRLQSEYRLSVSHLLSMHLYSQANLSPDHPVSGVVRMRLSTNGLPFRLSLRMTQAVHDNIMDRGRIAQISSTYPLFSSGNRNLSLKGKMDIKDDWYGSETGISMVRLGVKYSERVTKSLNISAFGNYDIPTDRDRFPCNEHYRLGVLVRIRF
jgi:hypothetical protein